VFEQVKRSKTFLILYPFLQYSTTGIAIITGAPPRDRKAEMRERKKLEAERADLAELGSEKGKGKGKGKGKFSKK
jgi:hypothetical protein